MELGELKIFARRAHLSDNIELFVREKRPDGVAFAQPLTFVHVEPGAHPSHVVTMTNTEAQTLMDELWQCGLRPSEGTGSAGAMAATQKHLHDMQLIAQTLMQSQGKLVDTVLQNLSSANIT